MIRGSRFMVKGNKDQTVLFCFSCCAARPKAVLRYWAKGCQACLDRTWDDALEPMLAEHAAQTSVFIVFVESLPQSTNKCFYGG